MLENDNNFVTCKAQSVSGSSSLNVHDFLKSIQLENLVEREQVRSDVKLLHHMTLRDCQVTMDVLVDICHEELKKIMVNEHLWCSWCLCYLCPW